MYRKWLEGMWRVWKKAAVTYFKVLTDICLEALSKTTKIRNHDIWSPSRDSKAVSRESEAGMLTSPHNIPTTQNPSSFWCARYLSHFYIELSGPHARRCYTTVWVCERNPNFAYVSCHTEMLGVLPNRPTFINFSLDVCLFGFMSPNNSSGCPSDWNFHICLLTHKFYLHVFCSKVRV
jgi:hypothetical protein